MEVNDTPPEKTIEEIDFEDLYVDPREYEHTDAIFILERKCRENYGENHRESGAQDQ